MELMENLKSSKINLEYITITIGDKQSLVYVHTIGIVSKGLREELKIMAKEATLLEFKGDEKYNTISLVINGKRYFVSSHSFVQSNPAAVEKLFQHPLMEFPPDYHVLELFCGWGMLSFFLSKEAVDLVGVEAEASSKNLFFQNARINGVSNVMFQDMRVEDYLRKNRKYLKAFDLLFLDPPRTGLKKSARRILKEANFRKILYLSCEAQTQYRDLEELINKNYKVEGIAVFDWFPQTFHFETLVKLNGRA